ncbi:MAG: S-layer homology domain-containing protein [Acidimicrobiia bacterium]|nr:S-layer homology domain-containing protein [Acidimicrobiia bacterium]
MSRFRSRAWGEFLVVVALVALTLPAVAAQIFVERFDADPFPPLPEPPPVEEPPPGEEPPEEPEPEPLWDPNWIDVRTADIDNTTLVSPGYVGDAVGIEVPAGTNRGAGARYYYPGDDDPDEAWFRYMLRFDDWNATTDGKLPGFAGLYGATARGCLPSTEASPGWSARVVFKADGTSGAGPGETRLGYYVYHLDQPTSCGETMLWDPGVLADGRWYCVEGHARMNTLGQNDGTLGAWLDGEQAITWDGLAFRRETEDFMHIREFWLNVFFGGTAPTPNDLHLSLDQLVVSDTGRVGCPDPFSDDNGSVHEPALTELKALGVYNGCATQTSCLDDELSRWAMAVLLDRALDLPVTGTDFFIDDDGLWARGHIDRLAAAGITNGCEPMLFCPEDSITRAEFAVMLDRAFGFPETSVDVFADDDGHWAESTFNRLGEAGVTLGCEPGRYCPSDVLPRGQAASLLRRALDWQASD